MKNSQVTVFVIMGIVIIAVFAFTFFIIDLIISDDLSNNPKKTIVDQAVVDGIKNNVQSCFDSAFEEGLTLLGEQGGYIRGEQGGGVIDFAVPSIVYGRTNVSIRIESADQNSPPYGDDLKPRGFIPPLCYESIIQNGYSCTCDESNQANCRYSIQSQLEAYILNKTKECFNTSLFPGYDLTPKDSSIHVVFGKSDVTSDLRFPLVVQYLGGQPISEVYDFHSVQDVKFAFIYEMIFLKGRLIRKDASNLTFDISRDSPEVLRSMFRSFKFSAFDISVSVDKVEPFIGDIVIVNDTSSLIRGRPYIFMFARRDRYPILDYFSSNPQTIDGKYYDLYAEVGDTLEVRPMGSDPDEDNLRFLYSGWLDSPNVWEDSVIYTAAGCLNQLTGAKDLFRCASYTVQEEDIGKHDLILTAKDPSGLSDSQTIRIFIGPIT